MIVWRSQLSTTPRTGAVARCSQRRLTRLRRRRARRRLRAARGCGVTGRARGPAAAIVAVGAENQYANVIAQVGGSLREGDRDREQPEHRSAHLRGEPERRRGRRARRGWSCRTGSATTPSWNRSSRPRGARSNSSAQGDRRAEAARAAGLHAQPAPLVQAADDARGRERARRRPSRPAARARRLLRGATRPRFERSLTPWYRGARAVRRRIPGHARSRPPSRSATTCSRRPGRVNLTPFACRRTS